MLKKILLILAAGIGFLLAFLLVRTLTFSSKQMEVSTVQAIEVPSIALKRFQQSIQFETISYIEPERLDTAAFEGFKRFMTSAYPLVDSLLEKQYFNHSLLYRWKGKDPEAKAVVMMGHYDVVPVDSSSLDKWEAGPFSGEIKEDKIYGRGAMDDKINVIGWMEAVEIMVKEGFQPKQDIYLAFGHDEEVGGKRGAKLIAEYLKEKGVKIAFAIDEGGMIAEGMLPGLSAPLAIINTGEKGYVSFKLTINAEGGHSSSPPPDNTVGSLARAIVKLEENQFPYRMIPVLRKQLSTIGPELDNFSMKMVFANTWLFGGPILQSLGAHTTTAPTMLSGGVKDNVIPTQASAVVNFRIMPGNSVEDVRQHIIKTVDDPRISLETVSNVDEPASISSDEAPAFKVVEKTIRELFPGIIVSPGLLNAGTDSKHFIGVAEQVYRFVPTRINETNFSCFHGNNEHVSIKNFEETIQFNYQLVKNLGNYEL